MLVFSNVILNTIKISIWIKNKVVYTTFYRKSKKNIILITLRILHTDVYNDKHI